MTTSHVSPSAGAPGGSPPLGRAAHAWVARASRLAPYLVVALSACSWGTWSLWLRRAESIGALSPALEATIVLAVITCASGLATVRDRSARRPSWKACGWVVWLGVTDAFNVLLFFAATRITIGVAVLSHYLTPVFVAVASPFALREKIGRRTGAAVVASLLGLAVMLAPTRADVSARALLTCAALGAGSAFFYASNVIANKFVVDELTTSEAVFLHGLIATPLLAAFVPPAAWAAVDPRAAGFLAAIAIWPGAIAALAFNWGLRRMPAAHASTLTLLEPLVAVLLGAAVFGEPLGPPSLAGAALVLGGAFAVVTQAQPPPRAVRLKLAPLE
ncbi:MAG: DMT family transporter [Polyangiaceae bacterium]|nr:DMT family transporter [Polyangiaceae bacterium]